MKKQFVTKINILRNLTGMEEDEVEFQLDVNAYVCSTLDRNYGADADGNRGICTLEINDVEIEFIVDRHTGEEFIPTAKELEEIKYLVGEKYLEQ